ncbi:MAG: hypothetical protein LBS21_02405 [Clostridiales bacterium]|nr:hypothetical protein [Clostridiales bacterium]
MIDEDEPYDDFRKDKDKTKDLAGRKFGLLTAEHIAYIGEDKSAYWHCKCECQNTTVVRGALLTNGSIMSCGCGNGSAEHVATVKEKTAKYKVDKTNITLLSNKKGNRNTSGRRGVSFNKRKARWEAYIQVNKAPIHLGLFEKFEDAVSAREAAEEKYFGKYINLLSEVKKEKNT